MNTNDCKVSANDIHDFIQTKEGWGLFLMAMFDMAQYHRAISSNYDNTSGQKRDLLQFEASAAVVDFLNALLSNKAARSGE